MNLTLPFAADEPSAPASLLQSDAACPPPEPAADVRCARIDADLVHYRLRRSRRRTIGFVIDARGLTITAPHRVTLTDIDRAIAEKARWIARKLAEWRDHAVRRERMAVRWEHGAALPVLGEPVRIAVGELSARALVEPMGAALHVRLPGPATEEALRHAVHGWLKGHARGVFEHRLGEFAHRHGVSPARWALSSARTRWGSCSSTGAIRLNWRLVHFPLSIIDYVIAHELAHLAELNHSARFWQRVAVLCPDWQRARRWLREHPGDVALAA